MIVPLVYSFPYGLIFWLLYGLVMLPETLLLAGRLRRSAGGDASGDRGSLGLILVGVWLAIVLGSAVAFLVPAATLRHGRLGWFWLGSAVLLAGSLLRLHCLRMLGRYFTPAVTVREGQSVVERGAYRFVRHPSYTGALLLLLGFALALTNGLSVVVMMAIGGVIYAYRIRVEEAALVARLGEPYRDYMRRTKRLVPFLI
ncbi:MAG: methyltransferase family protein [Acidobacteriota bacterium]